MGTYSFGARTYDPTLRRWVSPDPLLAGLPGLDESVGDNLNLYAYAGNNPVARIDLTGFEGTPLWQRALNVGRAVFGMVDPGAPLKAVVTDSVELARAASEKDAKLTAGGVVRGAAQATAEKVENESGVASAAIRASGAAPGALAAAVPKGDPKDIGPLVGKAIVNHVLPAVAMARASTAASTSSASAAAETRTPRRPTTAQKEAALQRSRGPDGQERCVYCGTKLDSRAGKPNSAEIDHKKAYSKGGETVDHNLNAACRTCNRGKGAKDLGTEWVPPKDRK